LVFFCGSRKTLGPKTLGPKNSSLSKKNQRVLFRQKAEGFLVTPKGFGKEGVPKFPKGILERIIQRILVTLTLAIKRLGEPFGCSSKKPLVFW